MAAFVLAQIPDPYVASSVAGYQLALIGMNHHIIDRTAMIVVPLDSTSLGIPYLHRAIL